MLVELAFDLNDRHGYRHFMRDLIRSTEGEISAGEFRRGAGILLAFSLGMAGLLIGVRQLSVSMEWMTVAVAPFFGALVLVTVCSLIYFWYCVFVKRLRAVGSGFLLLNAWLATLFIASAARLLDYQNRTLGLADSGPIAWSGFVAVVFSVLAVILFVMLLLRGWRNA